MHSIIQKRKLAEETYLIEINAPEIASKARAGQFVILRINEYGERIPLTLSDWTSKSITLVFQAVGRTTRELAALKKGNGILDLTGPLGNPSTVEEVTSVCLVGGGLGIAPLYPIAKEFKKKGAKVISIIGARTKGRVFWEDKLKNVTDNLMVYTDDGSYGKKGFVTDALRDILRRRIERVYAIGPLIMMKNVCNATRHLVKTRVSINSIMIDGIGMCGGCRLTCGGKIRFSCVDGPEFDGHKIDFDELLNRNRTYEHEERTSCRCR